MVFYGIIIGFGRQQTPHLNISCREQAKQYPPSSRVVIVFCIILCQSVELIKKSQGAKKMIPLFFGPEWMEALHFFFTLFSFPFLLTGVVDLIIWVNEIKSTPNSRNEKAKQNIKDCYYLLGVGGLLVLFGLYFVFVAVVCLMIYVMYIIRLSVIIMTKKTDTTDKTE